MSEETLPEETLPEDTEEKSEDLEGGAEGGSSEQTIKDKLAEVLGKEFKDDETALKAVKDTFDHVGKREEDIRAELEAKFEKKYGKGKAADLAEQIAALEKKTALAEFYSEHPEHKPYKDYLERFGDDPNEAIKDPHYKKLFEKLSAFDKQETDKSVIHSNRISGEESDQYKKDFEKAQKTGNWSDFLAKHKGVK